MLDEAATGRNLANVLRDQQEAMSTLPLGILLGSLRYAFYGEARKNSLWNATRGDGGLLHCPRRHRTEERALRVGCFIACSLADVRVPEVSCKGESRFDFRCLYRLAAGDCCPESLEIGRSSPEALETSASTSLPRPPSSWDA